MKPKQFLKKAVVHGLIASLALTQVLAPAYATDIADVPMAVKNNVPPNMMFMLDSSGSMLNVVPDDPYDPNTVYLASCPSGNTVAAGTSVDLRIVSSGPRLRYSGANYVLGTLSGQRCFTTTASYGARLNADSGTQPSTYLGSVYSGNYLNWYFNATNTTPQWNSGQQKKPATQTRMEIARTASKLVIDSLNNVRVGLSSYNSVTSGDGGELLEIMGPISVNRTRVKQKIDAITPSGNTPLSETLSDIGRYFTIGYSGNLTLHPGQANESIDTIANAFSNHSIRNNTSIGGFSAQTIVPPIQYFCQKSFTVLMTDGRPQGDQGITGSLADYDGDCSGSSAGNCFASPSHDRKLARTYESAGSDYLDDVAQGLMEMDLRPDLTNPDLTAPPKKNNVLTYTIGFADDQVINDPLMQDTATNGGGLFVTADDTASLVNAFKTVSDDILSKEGSAAAVAVANADVTSGDNASYASSYTPGIWTGDLDANPIDLNTGEPDTSISLWTGGSAKVQLDVRTPASRKIATHTGNAGQGQGIQFQPASAPTATKLSSTQQNLLNTPVSPPGLTDGAAVVSYIRGDRSGESGATPPYRSRTHLLGDIINSEPVIVREPKAKFFDNGYAAYKTAQASRTKMVYQGANDGMLHAFNGDTGAEEWAYIPSFVLPSLNNLSRKNGFVHKFYVDGTPIAADADLQNTDGAGGAPDWRTILVGGLRKGGRGYYALDVTNPLVADEPSVAAKALWEFPNAGTSSSDRLNVGYTFTKPTIAKTRAKGWVALVTSGYNNGTGASDSGGDGKGYLYVLNARTGEVIKAISTNVGSATDPSGLGQLSAFAENGAFNATVEYVYAGDLKGNLWRFDLTSTDINQWGVAKLATLVDGAGSFQPVTTAPELGEIKINGVEKRFVYVGTGQYLGDSDIPGATGANAHASQTQTFYGLLDDLSTNPEITPLRSTLQQQTVATSSSTQRTYSANAVDYTTKRGWYLDLPETGERANTDPFLASGALIFTTNIPNTDPCTPGGSSWFNVLDYKTGGHLTGSTVSWSAVSLGNALASRAVLVKLGKDVFGLVRKSNSTTTSQGVPLPPSLGVGKRVFWRDIMQ